ncbi:MAG: endonuclease MutS2 [Lentisphaeria bacterium]
MNKHTSEVLEYQALLELIAGYVQSPSGRQIILASCPQSFLPEIQARHGLYQDLLTLRESPRSLPGLYAEDLSEILQRVAPGDAVLPGEELVACRAQLDTVADVREFLQQRESKEYVSLLQLGSELCSCDALRNALQKSLDRDGTVLDSASETLRRLRQEIVALERRLQRSLEDLLKNSEFSDVIQERFVTTRNGRYVIPVRRDARSQLPGLIHDHSNSGQTVFLEPGVTLPLGNELASLRLQERDEIRRILAQLSAGVRGYLPDFQRNQRILAEIDAGAAVARWATDYSCHLPVFGSRLKLRQAYHPLLLAQFRSAGSGRQVVPLGLELPSTKKAMVITGSNTGGKTVALKTIGLLVLAAQSGFPVPAGTDSVFAVFERVFADIGDEQSLQANLSTFSAHVGNIADILQSCRTGYSLVLMDELGSGTDPLEGGAIACGILSELSQLPCLTIATTHLGMVKNFVHSHPDMINAAVRFNIDTLKPEYALDIGRPGASHALLIARRLGLPVEVLQTAEGLLSGEELRLEEVLARMETEQQRLSSRAAQAKTTRDELLRDREILQQELASLRKERKKLLHEAFQQAGALVENARGELERTLAAIRKSGQSSALTDEDVLGESVGKARRLLVEKEKTYQDGLRRTAATPLHPLRSQELQTGQKVWVEKLKAHGRIEGFFANREKVVVLVNHLPVSMKTADLQGALEEDVAQSVPAVKVTQPRFAGNTSHEINLIGLRVEEALEKLDCYLNDCLLANLEEVRVVHGFGTGRLRQGIHQWLRQQSQVASFYLGRDHQDPGGAGVSIVKLK